MSKSPFRCISRSWKPRAGQRSVAPPLAFRSTKGPEFVSKVLDRSAYEQQAELAFSRPRRPTDNGYIKASNGRLRKEFLNQHWP
jgi:putative transposase